MNRVKKQILGFLLFCITFMILGGCSYTEKNTAPQLHTNVSKPDSSRNSMRMTLLLAAPSVHNSYYKEHFEDIVDFQVGYINTVLDHGNDDIYIIVDEDTLPFFRQKIPAQNIIAGDVYDIWMRDFTSVNPYNPVQFLYTSASMSPRQSKEVQNSFNAFAQSNSISFSQQSYFLDGGNIVDNYDGKLVTTTRFLEDNNLSYAEGKKVLQDVLGVKEVAIIEPDDDILAHSDGMVSWIDTNVLAVNDYSGIDAEFYDAIMEELESSFTGIRIVPVPVKFDTEEGYDTEKGISSACGVTVNAVLTQNSLYIPVFGTDAEQKAIEIITANTTKEVIKVEAHQVCGFGGSVRCLTWQIDKDIKSSALQEK